MGGTGHCDRCYSCLYSYIEGGAKNIRLGIIYPVRKCVVENYNVFNRVFNFENCNQYASVHLLIKLYHLGLTGRLSKHVMLNNLEKKKQND